VQDCWRQDKVTGEWRGTRSAAEMAAAWRRHDSVMTLTEMFSGRLAYVLQQFKEKKEDAHERHALS
jgi:hypothetical protein